MNTEGATPSITEASQTIILVVEDDPGLSELMRDVLQNDGWVVIATRLGSEALAYLKEHSPDLLILDYCLPDMNGEEFHGLIEHEELSLCPFLVVTGVGDERTAVEMMKRGARDYLVKDSHFLNVLPVAVKKVLEQVQHQRQLAHALGALRRLGSAVHQSADSIVITDTSGNIEYVNPAFEKVTGYSSSEAIGQNPRILKSGKQDDAFYREMWTTITQGGVWSGRMVNRRKDGILFHEDATISPVQDEQGQIVHYVAVKKDITKEVALEEQLRQSQKMEAVGLLAGGVAHDLNNLLTPILGYGEMLLRSPGLDETYRRDVLEMVEAGKRARDLVRQLMAFGRKQVLEIKPLDLNEVVSGFRQLLRRTLHEDIHIDLVLEPVSKTVMADQRQMEQVLMNLAVNAQDAMPNGGTLTIETLEVELDGGHPGLSPGRYVRLSVRDTGKGMDLETQSRIFEPFFTTKELGKGTGLGLATVYGIIKQHGGDIRVHSEPGDGTTFQIFLPAIHRENSIGDRTMEKDPNLIPAVTGTGTILVAEDDPTVRQLTCSMLKTLGYRVLSGETAVECIHLASRSPQGIDLLLTDVVMPGMNGKELYFRLKESIPNLKVIFMSGHTSEVIVDRGVTEGGVEFLQKPFNLMSLAQKIHAMLASMSA